MAVQEEEEHEQEVVFTEKNDDRVGDDNEQMVSDYEQNTESQSSSWFCGLFLVKRYSHFRLFIKPKDLHGDPI